MKGRLNLIKASAVIVLLASSASALAEHAWSVYHIATKVHPIPLKVVDSMTNDWQDEFDTSLSKWNQSSRLAMVVDSANDKRNTRKKCNMVNGQMRVCNANYGGVPWAGLATIYIDNNGHITKGTAKMNDFYSYDQKFRNHLACQEIGHVFGLGHTSEDGSSQGTCMDYSNDISSQWPNSHDYDMLELIYGHLDSYNSYDDSDGGGDPPDDGGGCKAPPGKGCNKNGAGASVGGPPMGLPVYVGLHHEIWIAADGNDGYWVHRVTLVPEEFDRR